jgi:hypothetical protein
MKRRIGFAALFLFLVINAGCPYTTKTPLGVPDRGAFDARLVGLWMGYDGEEAVGLIRVFAFNDAEYYVETGGEADDGPDRYRAFVFKIDGQAFLQFSEIDEKEEAAEYCFARYSLSADGTIELRFVGEKIVPKTLAADPKALGAFIAAHLDDPALDDEDVRLILKKRS